MLYKRPQPKLGRPIGMIGRATTMSKQIKELPGGVLWEAKRPALAPLPHGLPNGVYNSAASVATFWPGLTNVWLLRKLVVVVYLDIVHASIEGTAP